MSETTYPKSRENLVPGGENRRTWKKLKAEGKNLYQTPRQIHRIIQRNKWPYKTRLDYYNQRDLALASLLYLSSGRVNEVLRLRARQFVEDPDDPDFLVIHSFWISKRKGGKHEIVDIPLPRVGQMKPFTEYVEAYLQHVDPDEMLFKFGKSRALAIVKYMTDDPDNPEDGYWCHWFRAQSLSYWVNTLRSTIVVASDRGIKNPQTLKHYYTGGWKEHKDELKQ